MPNVLHTFQREPRSLVELHGSLYRATDLSADDRGNLEVGLQRLNRRTRRDAKSRELRVTLGRSGSAIPAEFVTYAQELAQVGVARSIRPGDRVRLKHQNGRELEVVVVESPAPLSPVGPLLGRTGAGDYVSAWLGPLSPWHALKVA